jgi:hypothetical protein
MNTTLNTFVTAKAQTFFCLTDKLDRDYARGFITEAEYKNSLRQLRMAV